MHYIICLKDRLHLVVGFLRVFGFEKDRLVSGKVLVLSNWENVQVNGFGVEVDEGSLRGRKRELRPAVGRSRVNACVNSRPQR